MLRKLLFLAVLTTPALAFATEPELSLHAAWPFQAQQQKIRADLQEGEVYSEISAVDRDRVIAALDRMSRAVGDGSIEALPPEGKGEVLNDHQLVNSVLRKARADSRLICKRESAIGSRMTTKQCFTVAQRERMKRNADSSLRSVQGGGVSAEVVR